jgi:hypothetical protein
VVFDERGCLVGGPLRTFSSQLSVDLWVHKGVCLAAALTLEGWRVGRTNDIDYPDGGMENEWKVVLSQMHTWANETIGNTGALGRSQV